MKITKKATIGLIVAAMLTALTLAGSNVFARGRGMGDGTGAGCGGCDGKGGGPGGFHHLEYMKTELGLTDEQVKKIFDIGTQYRQKYFDNRGNPDKIKALREEHRKAVDSVLTKEQKEKREKLFESGSHRGHGKGMHRHWDK
jgi:hypothetical protein